MTRRRVPLALRIGPVLALLAGLALWALGPDPWGRRGPAWEKYQKVQLGMTEQEVNAILGPPGSVEGGGLMPSASAWFYPGGETIAVGFGVPDGATEKHFRATPNSWWVEDPPRPVIVQAWKMVQRLWPW